MNLQLILFNPLTAALAIYVAISAVLTLVVQPVRKQMVMAVEELMAESWVTKSEREFLENLASHCMSFIIAIALPFTIVSTTIDAVVGARRTEGSKVLSPRLRKDPRFHQVVQQFFLSILAGNPVLAILSITLMVIKVAILKSLHRDGVVDAMERPVMKAADAKFHMPQVAR